MCALRPNNSVAERRRFCCFAGDMLSTTIPTLTGNKVSLRRFRGDDAPLIRAAGDDPLIPLTAPAVNWVIASIDMHVARR